VLGSDPEPQQVLEAEHGHRDLLEGPVERQVRARRLGALPEQGEDVGEDQQPDAEIDGPARRLARGADLEQLEVPAAHGGQRWV
jgi:hypothetical protein